MSRSKFWRETCIFAIEDDPQEDGDHVSGYRTTCYVISPSPNAGSPSARNKSDQLIRTMELILGLPPESNGRDGHAMTDCFMEQADFTPLVSVHNQPSSTR